MKVKENQIFNLMDTNGRRYDVIEALQGYLIILDDVLNRMKMKWDVMPNSLAQYDFYRQAIELSPDVFAKHDPYDKLINHLKNVPEFYKAVQDYDMDWINNNCVDYSEIIKQFDLGIEDRAKHYTSNLVKLGFASDERQISPTGELLLNLNKVKKDRLETLLPIDEVNIIYLRQLMKLRIFDMKGEKYYSPFNLAIYALLKRQRMSENEFFELVQGLGPYSDFSSIEQYVLNYETGKIVEDASVTIPNKINVCNRLSNDDFFPIFKNRKSTSGSAVYWKFYNLLFDYVEDSSASSICELLNYFESNKAMLNKAFGCGKNIFPYRNGERPSIERFAEDTKSLFNGNLNVNLYKLFSLSKSLDQIREYSDTTKRIFKATGIIYFENGYVELAYKEICTCIFNDNKIMNRISGNINNEYHLLYKCYNEYEKGTDSYFCRITSLAETLACYEEQVEQIEQEISAEFSDAPLDQISQIVADRRRLEFVNFIAKEYPIDKVKFILGLFGDRSNDNKIKAIVSKDATVPTIYEYIVGLAWYYFSGKRIDLLASYNLSLSANFEPLVHAGGGQGDIVIYEDEKVVMLEATLMNANSQKRGEWEPVLRHSINLKIEEESKNTGRGVTSFFIADSFDYNTINIWKAIAGVPLQSSIDKTRFTDNVVIMPVNTDELIILMDKANDYDSIISKVHELFEVDKVKFDIQWRDKFMNTII